MARTREFDPEEVLQIAVELFWQRGYGEASVDELMRRSGVAKYGIYGTFGSKRELFKQALARYEADRHADMQSPIRAPGAALPEIRAFFKRALQRVSGAGARRGCLMVNTGVELGSRDAEVGECVRAFFDDLAKALQRCLVRAIELGQLDPSVHVEALATYLATEFRTALALAASGSSRREIQNHLDISLTVLGQ